MYRDLRRVLGILWIAGIVLVPCIWGFAMYRTYVRGTYQGEPFTLDTIVSAFAIGVLIGWGGVTILFLLLLAVLACYKSLGDHRSELGPTVPTPPPPPKGLR